MVNYIEIYFCKYHLEVYLFFYNKLEVNFFKLKVICKFTVILNL